MGDLRDNDKLEQSPDKALGKIVNGVVKDFWPYAALLKLEHPSIVSDGYLHISNITNSYINHPQDILSIGQRLPVQILYYDSKSKCWEVSHISALLKEYSLAKYPVGTKCKGKVIKVGDFGVIIELPDGILARLRGTNETPYLIYTELGRIEPNKELWVEVIDWDRNGKGLLVVLSMGEKDNISYETIYEGTIVYFDDRTGRTRPQRDKHRGAYNIWVELDTRELIRCNVSNYVHPEKHFIVGERVQIKEAKIIYKGKLRYFLRGTIEIPPALRDKFGTLPRIGTVFEDSRIINVLEWGAFCVISDGVHGVIHHTNVVEDTVPNMKNYLREGDVVKVKVSDVDSERERIWLKLLKVVKKGALSTPMEEPESLIDLASEKKKGAVGGYARDRRFREIVLEAFNYQCCVCGQKIIMKGVSAIQAAHIIPRSSRGSNTLSNALALCMLHHWAFDRGYFTIDQNGQIEVCGDILADPENRDLLAHYHREQVEFQEGFEIPIDALAWHRRNIFFE